MALINCSECGKEISDKALTCPNCGAPVENDERENIKAKKSANSQTSKTYMGIIALGLGFAAIIMPYFAAVFLVPAAFITGAIAIKQKQELLGILAIALSLFGLSGIFEVSREIDQATKEIERIFEDPFNVDNIDEDSLIITYDKYQQIQDGMTYEEVKEIIGNPGEELSRTSVGDYTFTMYSWTNPNASNMTATFENDRLSSKSQFGLR